MKLKFIVCLIIEKKEEEEKKMKKKRSENSSSTTTTTTTTTTETEIEIETEERLREFGKECQTIGSLRCFQYFEAYLRGKEELVVMIKTTKTTWRLKLLKREGDVTTGTGISTERSPPLPPASPCARETENIKTGSDAVFLVSSYATYGRPLVWLRSSVSRSTTTTTTTLLSSFGENDKPLSLLGTDLWRKGEEVSAVHLTLGETIVNSFFS